ncbi:MAG TPA: NUDIX domain-containing protein, partial [Burkholderiaceae bacterium]|nr:NUDIX domain-containing protein [Burkholderiaceae bacterium]
MHALALPAARDVVPRAAATTLVLRDSTRGPEVLMVKRSPHASFMPGAYVFPGGAVDAGDADAALDEPARALI